MSGLDAPSPGLGEAVDPLRVMQRVVDEAVALVEGADGAAVELADAGGMTYVAAAGRLAGSVGLRLAADASLSGLAVRARSVLRCDDSETDRRVDREACRKVGVRSMICVPLLRADAAVGVLKISASEPAAFDERDVATLRRLAEFVGFVIDAAASLSGAVASALSTEPAVSGGDEAAIARFVARVLVPAASRDAQARRRIRQVIDDVAFFPVFQPVVDLATGATVGVEALTRFTPTPPRGPDCWFADAHAAGLGPELELATLRVALGHLDRLPEGLVMAVNLSPDAIAHPDLASLTGGVDLSRLTIEVTEHAAVDDYAELRRLLAPFRRRGARLAVDDTGAGFASFSHIIQLAPDIIKLDLNLTRGIDLDPVRRSLATAVVAFAADTGSSVVAEGIETEPELGALRGLRISHGQGYLLGRPAALADLDLRSPAGASPLAHVGR